MQPLNNAAGAGVSNGPCQRICILCLPVMTNRRLQNTTYPVAFPALTRTSDHQFGSLNFFLTHLLSSE